MCGLVAVISKKNKSVAQKVFSLYKKQDGRGKQGFGYLAISKDWILESVQRSKYEVDIKPLLMKEKAPIILFHHRFPTSTENTLQTTHPMFVKHDELEFDWCVAHNGGIINNDSIKSLHEKLGYTYTTEFVEQLIATNSKGEQEILSDKGMKYNDSECFAIELARHLEGLSDEVSTKGTVAFWCIKLKKNTKEVLSIFYGHNKGRELTKTENKKFLAITSIGGTKVDEMKIYSYDKGDNQLYRQSFPIDEAKPAPKVEPTTYFRSAGNRAMSDFQRGQMRDCFAKLSNRYHTYSEALLTGVPMGAFDITVIDDYSWYVPKKFKQYAGVLARPSKPRQQLLSDKGDVAEEIEAKERVRAVLEQLCIKHVQLTKKLEDADACYDAGFLSEHERDNSVTRTQNKIDEIEASCACMEVSQDEVDEMMELCSDMEQYNEAYKEIFLIK